MFSPARVFTSKNRRTPLPIIPRRPAGQSIDEQIRAVQSAWVDVLSLPLCLTVLACYEWWRWLFSLPPNPWLLTVVAAVAVHAARRRRKLYRSELMHLRHASPAQPATNQLRDLLRAVGLRLAQDVTVRRAPAAMAASLRRFLSPANGLAKRLATAFMNHPG